MSNSDNEKDEFENLEDSMLDESSDFDESDIVSEDFSEEFDEFEEINSDDIDESITSDELSEDDEESDEEDEDDSEDDEDEDEDTDDSEEDDEDEDEDSDEDASSIKGMPIKLIAAAVLGVSILGAGAYLSLSGNDNSEFAAEEAFQQQFQPTVISTQDVPDVVPTQLDNFPAPEESSINIPTLDDTASLVEDNSLDIPSSPLIVGGAETVEKVIYQESIDEDTFRAIIKEELRLQSAGDRKYIKGLIDDQTDDVLMGLSSVDISGIETKLASLGVTIADTSEKLDNAVSEIQSFAEREVKTKLSDTDKKKLTGKRQRLAGFEIVNSSEDYEMSIVRSPSGRISTLFEGEVFYVDGKTHYVRSVHGNGTLLLVDDKYYIDETYVKPAPKPKTKKTVKKQAKKESKQYNSKKSVKSKVSANLESSDHGHNHGHDHSKQSSSVDLSRYETVSNTEAAKSYAMPKVQLAAGDIPTDGWSFHGIFDDGYLLNNPEGNWVILRNGEQVKGLGVVSGVDQYRQLLIGKYLIPLSM